ncbi:MAG: energy-coupling factor ABC transporter permease, partial [Chloroflexota bacterium]
LIGYGLFRMGVNRSTLFRRNLVAAAAWISVIAAALLTSTQLWISSTSPAQVVFPAMLGVHALIGIGEALITVAAFSFITQVRPDLLTSGDRHAQTSKGWMIVGGLISLLVVLFAPLASAFPDGLERVAEDLGFLNAAQDSPFNLFADYLIPALGDSALSTIGAGILGICIVGGAAYLIGRAVRKPTTISSKE